MGKGRPRAVEKVVLGPSTSGGSLNIPSGPVYYPTEDEFKDPLEFIYKIRPEAEKYGICKIVPPKSWNSPFALDVDSFMFPTKTQAIHQLQARSASCDSKTFRLEYNRFLEGHCGKKARKRVVFEGDDLDLCKLFNAVKRYGGYDNVVKNKKWGDVFRFVRPGQKISECAKIVLSQLYIEHLCDYEEYYNKINKAKVTERKRGMQRRKNCGGAVEISSSKRRRKNNEGEKVEVGNKREEVHHQMCEQCGSGLHGEVMLLCDRCNKGWHIYCLSPPLEAIPVGNWYCLDCVNSEKDSFGFVPGKEFSLEAFKRVAERAKKKWFGSAVTSRVQLEKKFWEVVEGSVGEVEVMYGSDLDTSVYGSGFARLKDQRPSSIEVDVWDKCCASPWNLNNLPKLPGSMLRAVDHGIAGVMVPWLYIGMLFSSFCWHVEDHCFYSMNYHHWGEPKCWYSVPGSDADAFEKVMRNSLPDLFDAQPDLLFQLVTMLSPTVLQESGVPVYSVLQEPGNFIVTFPRSYHGGFNLGLNCAEAVNFAPADWLPHGGLGAELYQLYHKPPVLSHEELLCVVAQSDLDKRASGFLKTELLRIYNREKSWRERLWKNGVICSSLLPPRKNPKHVGTEEDPTCIICQQSLYLSAVVCRCRPSSYVCLEHSDHLCECKADQHQLLYRHTLAELNELVLRAENLTPECSPSRLQRQSSSSKDSLAKKVKGGYSTHVKLAEEWLLQSCKILEKQYSRDSYASAIKDAQQFVWAGSEMDPVRDVLRNLVEAQKWAQAVRNSISKIKSWSGDNHDETSRLQLDHVDKLLSVDPLPCKEPRHLKLKEYQQEAKMLILEIEQALTVCPAVSISDWEVLSLKICASPIYVKESEKLLQRLSSVKVWTESVRKCTNTKSAASVEVDVLYRLQAELLELEVQLPEGETLANLISQVESCRSRCCEMLKDSICLKNLQVLISEYDGFTVDVPELKLLREYYQDAMSWKSRMDHILENINCREDHENVVKELTSIQIDGLSLKVQVEELPGIDTELQKACCRVKVLKALESKMTMNDLEQVIAEANMLQIEKEKLFVDISKSLEAAKRWEDRAKEVLSNEEDISEFEHILRTSEDIFVILPSLDAVEKAFSMAKTWLSKSSPFLFPGSLDSTGSNLLKLDLLKELVLDSKSLKISLKEQGMLQDVLEKCNNWDLNASTLYDDAVLLLDSSVGNSSNLALKIEHQVSSLESIIESGLSFQIEFSLIPKLQDACSTLKWCFKGLTLCDIIPTLQEVEACLEISSQLPITYVSRALPASIRDGINWLIEALEVLPSCSSRQTKLTDAEKVLELNQKLHISFPLMVGQIHNAIDKHNLWLEQVILFFTLNKDNRAWGSLLHLKEIGIANAFHCSELDTVLAEVQKIEQWKQNCEDIAGVTTGDEMTLTSALIEIKASLDRSLSIYDNSKCSKTEPSCVSCSTSLNSEKFTICSICKDCFHLQCAGPFLEGTNCGTIYVCHYCNFVESGKISKNKFGPMKSRRKCADHDKLVELLSQAASLPLWMEERSILVQVVEKAVECSARLIEIVEFALAYHDCDLSIVAEKLVTALKAMDVAYVCDARGDSKFELVLARNSWKVRTQNLLKGLQKPTIQLVQRHLKEGQAISIPPEDYFMQKLTEARHISLQWAEMAKNVASDGGALGLDKVFELIDEGERLALVCEKELKLLRDRSMLYCICRKPYDQRAMIACDNCDEWYHFDCIKLSSPPKVYICPACDSLDDSGIPRTLERCTSGVKVKEPQTPSPRSSDLKKSRRSKSIKREALTENNSVSRHGERLLWRQRKPFRRLARKRANFDSLIVPFFNVPVDR